MTIWEEAEEALDGVQEFASGKPASYEDHAIRSALARGREFEEEHDVYEIALVKVSEWIREEKAKHERRARGGQMAGDSHSPRVMPSVLMELERLIRIEDARFTYEAMFEMQAKVDRYERALKTALKQLALKGKTLPLNVTETALAQDFSAALGLDSGEGEGS